MPAPPLAPPRIGCDGGLENRGRGGGNICGTRTQGRLRSLLPIAAKPMIGSTGPRDGTPLEISANVVSRDFAGYKASYFQRICGTLPRCRYEKWAVAEASVGVRTKSATSSANAPANPLVTAATLPAKTGCHPPANWLPCPCSRSASPWSLRSKSAGSWRSGFRRVPCPGLAVEKYTARSRHSTVPIAERRD